MSASGAVDRARRAGRRPRVRGPAGSRGRIPGTGRSSRPGRGGRGGRRPPPRDRSTEQRPSDERGDDDQRGRNEDDVAAPLDALAERVVPHAVTVAARPGPAGAARGAGGGMDTLLVERRDGVVWLTLDRPE